MGVRFRKGTVIIADNVVRNGAVLHDSDEDERVQGTREFFDLLKQEPRIEATAIQTVGEKGYDGFVYGIVNETKLNHMWLLFFRKPSSSAHQHDADKNSK